MTAVSSFETSVTFYQLTQANVPENSNLRSYRTKVDPGQSSGSMLNDLKKLENIPAIRDHNGKLTADRIEKANSLDSYYASLFSCERNDPPIQSTESGKPFTISINIIRGPVRGGAVG